MKIKLFLLFAFFCTTLFSQETFISEDILVMNDSIQLPGTLTYNPELKQQPLIIFVPGSGNPDRNGNQPQFGVFGNYIKQFAHKMSDKDVAFFRFDKRNVTPKNIKHILKHYEFNDLVKDVTAVINQFKDDTRFSSITLVGHSQGSLVAMIAVNEHITNYISLAGLGESVDKTLVRQYSAQNEEWGELVKQHITELKTTGDIKDINPIFAALFAKQNHEFLISYLKLNPTIEVKKLKIPVLILNGTNDLQVKEEDANNLHKANPDSKLVMIKNMNHVLKTIEKEEDNIASYTSPDFPISEKLIETVEAFIKK